MSFFSVDHIIVYAYLISMLFCGIIAGRGVKNIKDYAIASRSYAGNVMMITMLATLFGGTSTIGGAEGIYEHGWIVISMTTLAYLFSCFFIAHVIAPKMYKFGGQISIGGMMGQMYGKEAQLFTGVLGFIFCIATVAAQCKAIGYLLKATFNIDELYGVMLGATIFIIYSAFGGIKSVTITDVVQFAILIIVIPLIANVVVTEIGGIGALISQIPDEKLEVFNHELFWQFFVLAIVWSLFPGFLLSPAPMQRMLMAKNGLMIRNMYYVGGIMTFPFDAMVAIIGFSALVLYPDIKPGLAMPIIISTSLPIIIKGMAISAMLAVIMSTADSFLNSGAILLVNDIIKPLFKRRVITDLAFAKIATIIMGIAAIYVALNTNTIIELSFKAMSLWGPVMVIPVVYGIISNKTSESSFLAASAVTVSTFILCQQFLPEDQSYWKGLICIFVNGISFIIFNYVFRYERKVYYRNGTERDTEKERSGKKGIFTKISSISIRDIVDRSIAKTGSSHMMFAIFCCLNYIVPYYMWTHERPYHYEQMLGIRLLCSVMCIILLMEKSWPDRLKKYFGMYWYLTLCICLPFSTTIFATVMEFDTEWLINISLSIFLLSLLVDWVSFIILNITGYAMGYLYLSVFLPCAHFDLGSESKYMLIYILIFSSLIGLLFSSKRESYTIAKIDFFRRMSGMLAHEVKTPLAGVRCVSETLSSIIEDSSTTRKGDKVHLSMVSGDYQMLKNASELLNRSVNKGYMFIDTFTSAIKEDVPIAEKKEVSVCECLSKALVNFRDSYRHFGELKVKVYGDKKVVGSAKYIMHVFLNILFNAVTHGGNDVKIDVIQEGNVVKIRDNGKGISENVLPYIFDHTFSTAGSSGLGLSFCKMVMSDLRGSIICHSVEGKFTEFVLKF